MGFRWLLAIGLVAFLAMHCSGDKEGDVEENKAQEETAEKEKSEEEDALMEEEKSASQWQEPKKADVDRNKKYTANIKTSKGDVKVELFPKEAPLSVTNFKHLADKDFYKGLTFHRVVPKFVIQGGDPEGTGTGGPGYTLPAEIKLLHKEGALAWARLPETDPMGKPINPQKRSSGSQFYITLAPQPQLDGGYTVFGQTIDGMDVVNKIQRGDKILDIIVEVQ